MYCLDIEIYADRWEELEKIMQSSEYHSDYLGNVDFVETSFIEVSDLEDLEVAA